ncbi:MAG: ribosome maturation factor RimP [Fusobacteriota bacterium]
MDTEERKENQIYELAKPIAENMDLELVDVEYMQDGGYWYVRVYIDKKGGVTLDDCKNVTKKIEEDVDKIINREFFLEVSSPGLDRPLRTEEDFIRFTGKKANLYFKHRLYDARRLEGVIKEYKDSKVYLECEEVNETCVIPYKEIKKAKLVFEL